ncbi:trypsin alpha-like [Zootermopsis nevadensis]|uniref:trypsin alpha-like n=1 Tax=Zootermopsis nevadensis TaxID=136037 RepID=UPI000B8E6897|nr:trypsin alpha-like [Zootermopsis nevadensis]
MGHAVKSVCVLVVMLASASVSLRLGTKNEESSALRNSEPRIADGANATSNEFPYQVAIVAKGTATLRCGGALIGKNSVLTSAYCANLGTASDIQVVVGNVKLSTEPPSQVVDVDIIFVHEAYDISGRVNDLAVLQLAQTQNIGQPSVDVVKLRSSNVALRSQCSFTGWGSDTWNGAASDVLKKANLTILSTTDCVSQLGQEVQVDQICAVGEGPSNACFLDEGGPLVCDGELTGILSHSLNCGRQGKPSVYAEVAKHKAWIESHIVDAASVNSLSLLTILAMLTALTTFWNSAA